MLCGKELAVNACMRAEILDQIPIALYFIILAPEFEHVFGKANCPVLICLVLYE